MEFNINTAETLRISDKELSDLLTQVYVEGGFAEPEIASSLFEPQSVRARGIIIGAREKQTLILAGMVIIVPPDSGACRLAQAYEAEIHLLGVKPEYRLYGLGRMLVESAISTAKQYKFGKLILWTQTTMNAAQYLYKSVGFIRNQGKDINRNGREFWVYEKII